LNIFCVNELYLFYKFFKAIIFFLCRSLRLLLPSMSKINFSNQKTAKPSGFEGLAV